MQNIVNTFTKENTTTTIVKLHMSDDFYEFYYLINEDIESLKAYKYIEMLVQKKFMVAIEKYRQFFTDRLEGITLEEFSMNSHYIEYDTLHIVFSYPSKRMDCLEEELINIVEEVTKDALEIVVVDNYIKVKFSCDNEWLHSEGLDK